MGGPGRWICIGVLLAATLAGAGCNQRNGGSTIGGGNQGNGKDAAGSGQQKQQPKGGGAQFTEPQNSVTGKPDAASDDGSPAATAHTSVAEAGVPEGTLNGQGPTAARNRSRQRSQQPSHP